MDREAKAVKTKARAKAPAAGPPRGHKPSADRPVDQRLADALAQQAATAEILRAMAASPADAQPVMNAVAEQAARLCQAPFAYVLLCDGEVMRALAHYSADDTITMHAQVVPLRRTTITGRAVLERATIHHADAVPLLDSEYPDARPPAVDNKFRAVLAVPLLHKDMAIGGIFLWRREPGLFAPDQVALVETFATQAAIAIDNARLFHATHEALEQQKATSEILRVISRSPTDTRPVFDTIVRSARMLCNATFSAVYLVDGDNLDFASVDGMSPEDLAEWSNGYPRMLGPDTVSGRAALECRVVQTPDLGADPDYCLAPGTRINARTVLGVPLILGGRAIGSIGVWRSEVMLFSENQIALLQTFADQAVIAIENVRLFTELAARNRDLSESLEQQTATSEILRVISRSQTDAQPVFDTIAAAVLKLCRASAANVFTFDGRMVHLVSTVNPVNPEYSEMLKTYYPQLPSRRTAITRAIQTQDVVEIPDVLEDSEYAISEESNARRLPQHSRRAADARRPGDRRDRRSAGPARALPGNPGPTAPYLRRSGGDRDRQCPAIQRGQGTHRGSSCNRSRK